MVVKRMAELSIGNCNSTSKQNTTMIPFPRMKWVTPSLIPNLLTQKNAEKEVIACLNGGYELIDQPNSFDNRDEKTFFNQIFFNPTYKAEVHSACNKFT